MVFGLPFDIWLKVAVMGLPRLITMFFVIPLIGKGNFPGWLRTIVILALGLIIGPALAPTVVQLNFNDAPSVVMIIIKEVVIGLLLAFPLAIAYWSIQGIGYYIDNQRGAAIADTIDPLSSEQTSSLGILFSQAFIVYFFAVGGFNALLTYAYQSYGVWPVSAVMPHLGTNMMEHYLNLFGSMLRLIVLLSAPVILLMFVTELSLALISKFAPQLNVFFLALPIKSAMALFVLILYLKILFDNLTDSNFVFMSDMDFLKDLMSAEE